MPNEFEKQVQQLMDELKFIPSEPVWQKVEMQIRKKKDRRRMILWISFLVLLLGGGLWIGIDRYSNNIAYHKPNSEIQKQNLKIETPREAATKNTVTKATDDKVQVGEKTINKKTTITNSENKNNNELTKTKNKRTILINKPLDQKINGPKKDLVVEKKNAPVSNEETVQVQKIPEEIVHVSVEKKNPFGTSLKVDQHVDTNSVVSNNKEKTEPTISKTDSVKQNIIPQADTSSIKKSETKKLAESKWKFNLIVASGVSGLSRLSFFNGQKSMGALYLNSPGSSTGGMIYSGPSDVKKGWSFSLGASAQKQLSKRLVFSIGMKYYYYSNSILVGDKIRRDTVFRYAYAVSQYFTNARAAYSYSIAAERYRNHYHFISLPVTIEWQMFKKLPLNFYTGFSVQQMIQTNALTFDYSSQAYYHSDKVFNKTLVFTEYGLSYTFPLNKKFLTIGPQFQYGLSRLEKNNSDHHLFSYGLKAQLQLNKK